MTYIDRLHRLQEMAINTDNFAHNPEVRIMYYELEKTISERKNPLKAKQLIERMGF